MSDVSIYKRAEALFVDSLDNDYFVLLNKTKLFYSKLINSLKNPFKIILLYGRPGTGKSYLLQKFYNDHKASYQMFLYKNPTFDSLERLKEIYFELFGEELKATDLHLIIKAFRAKTKEPIFVLLDESQLYSDETLEWIRVLSNEEVFRFIIIVHKVDEEDLLAKEHFKTRTFETFELEPISLEEVGRFVETKLLIAGMQELYDKLQHKNFVTIYQITKGNLRDINRLASRLFSILDEAYRFKPHTIKPKLPNRFIEMAALDLGMI